MVKRVVAIAPARASSAVPCGRATPTARAVPALPRPRKRLTREELAPLAREALFRAAGKVVGESGYKDASVARITEAAGVALGTFYLYFETRQSLFDELLPHARGEMLTLVRKRVAGVRDFLELEERGMAAFLEYLRINPSFVRILNEAEAVAPHAYRSHYDDVAERYRRQLLQAAAACQIRRLDEAEMDTVVYLMMGARISLYQRCLGLDRKQVAAAVSHYMTMVRSWLALPEPISPAQPRRTAVALT